MYARQERTGGNFLVSIAKNRVNIKSVALILIDHGHKLYIDRKPLPQSKKHATQSI